MDSLSGGCGFCLSNHICCDLLDGQSPCLTCRDYRIKCPPGQETDDSGSTLEGDESPMEDVIYTPEVFIDTRFDLVDNAPSPIHWMVPLDHYKSVAHDLLGFPVPGLPDIVQPMYRFALPAFIQKLPALADEDIQYLAAKEIFSLPDRRLQSELLRTFVLHVHPYLPVLDLPIFLEAIANNDGYSHVSLLLFYAVMFSAIAFIDPAHIQRAGYTSRKAARQEFFRKARVLYDFDVEQDRIVLIQAVLLMTYWHENPDDPKDFRHWLEIALSQAALVTTPNHETLPSEITARGLWKRVWWCMYTRDRLNAMNLRRAPVIKDAEFTVLPPTLADFDIQQYPENVVGMLGNCEVLRRVDQQQQLAQMFIEKSKLCCTISGIIFPIATASNFSPAVFTHYIDALEEWQASLPADIQYRAPPSRSLSEGERALFAYRAWLKMIFLAASGALHRQNSQKPLQSDESGESNLHSVTRSIAGVAEGLHQLNLVHCLPTTTVGLLTPVLATHFMNIRSETPDLWRNAFQSLYQCMKVLEKLGEVYMLAESMAAFFQSAICRDENRPNRDSGIETAFLEKILTSSELESFEHLVGDDPLLTNS
ncbi:fungal-specific transcription factor domain-containing protein [Aspergillus cavernicola]|uniref:Fungal-specific transcription factor domain-containing protein n=1 Tax=Aspergillus cavernicola TaxID=176166 RepID=A0ABR4HHZ8_9EURO